MKVHIIDENLIDENLRNLQRDFPIDVIRSETIHTATLGPLSSPVGALAESQLIPSMEASVFVQIAPDRHRSARRIATYSLKATENRKRISPTVTV